MLTLTGYTASITSGAEGAGEEWQSMRHTGSCGIGHKRAARGAALGMLTLVGGALTLQGVTSCARPAPARGGGAGGWQTYKDAALGFTVQRPAGWSVHADEHTILVRSADRREVVFAEAFDAADGESAEDHLGRLPDRTPLFAQARVSDVRVQPSAGDEAAATLSYRAASGPGQGRVLCSVVHGKGLLFVLAAPGARFAADRPLLARVVRSLRFFAPERAARSDAPAAPGLHYVAWTDPREQAFTLSIPAGWKADGGAYRFGPSDVRIAYQLLSPDKSMTVLVGDPRLPTAFQTLNAMEESVGMRDGENGVLHYMPAPEFNHWYLETFVTGMVDGLRVGADHPLPDVARRQTEAAQRQSGGGMRVEDSVSVTEFSGRSKIDGKPLTGIVLGSTQRMSSALPGLDSAVWSGSPILLGCTDAAHVSRSEQTVMAVFAHLQQTLRMNPAWLARRSQELAQDGADIAQQGQQTLADTQKANQKRLEESAERSQQIARDTEAARSASMGAYWGHVQADGERQRGFIDYLGDRTDVTDGAGTGLNVPGGSKHYYRNGQTGAVLGTDSADSPGVDWTPLTQY